MATILITWELGASYGHVTRIRPVAESLIQRGHVVVFATREMKQAREVLADLDIVIVQAPYHNNRGKMIVKPTLAYADILRNCGFVNAPTLNDRVWAWLGLFELVEPDMILCDHSPTVLVAARLIEARTALLGGGFACPPNHKPMISLRPDGKTPADELLHRENRIIQMINLIMRTHHLPELTSLGQLFGEVAGTFLTTFEELDHFGSRKGVQYWGAWPTFHGQPPEWPDKTKKRVIAYLKPTPNYVEVLNRLTKLDAMCLVFGTWITPKLQQRFANTTVRLQREMIDFRHLAGNCDLAILNATHGSTCAMLLHGLPILQLPTHMEQELIARRTIECGAGLRAGFRNADQIAELASRMLADESFQRASQRVADKYSKVDPAATFDKMMDAVTALLP